VILGGSIVVLTGIYLLRRERRPVATLPASG